jgi:hypothetical protein
VSEQHDGPPGAGGACAQDGTGPRNGDLLHFQIELAQRRREAGGERGHAGRMVGRRLDVHDLGEQLGHLLLPRARPVQQLPQDTSSRA